MTVDDAGPIYDPDPMSALIFDGGRVVFSTVDDAGDVYQLTAEELKEKERAERKARQWQSMFSVRVQEVRGRKTEPERMAEAAQTFADGYLRRHPCLPADPSDKSRAWMDVGSGAWIPPVSCAVKGCSWCGGLEPVTRERAEAEECRGLHAWDAELKVHVFQSHGGVLTQLLDAAQLRSDDPDLIWHTYNAACAAKEREDVPVTGQSVDRRSMEYLQQVYNDDMVRSLMCFCCPRVRLDTCHVNGEIKFVDFLWLLKAESKNPGIVEKCFSQARFDEFSWQKGTPLAQRGSGAANDVRTPDFSDWQLRLRPELLAECGSASASLRSIRDGLLLCCPEDHYCPVQDCKERRLLCKACRIPLCCE